MKPSIIILPIAIIGIVVFVVACKKRGVQADVDAAVASGQYQFIALLDPEGKFTYPQVPGIPDWYFQGSGIRVRQTKPDTREADIVYMKSYNDALAQTLKAQGKFHVIEESVARVKANLDTRKQSGTTSLAEMMAAVQRDPSVSAKALPLERDWIGDVKDEEHEIERIRLEKGQIINGQIALLRSYPNGSYRWSDSPIYVRSIPNDKKLRSCSTVDEIEKLLGAGQSGFSAWGGPTGMNSSHSWVCFSPTAEDRLTYFSVFAHTSWNEEQRAKGAAQVAKLLIRRGELRPADPSNPTERKLYLSGADMFAAEEAAKAQARQRYPQPLRDLIVAAQHPDDSDLKHLSAAIQAIRDAPDPKLFAQIVTEIGTLRIRSLLNHILLNEHHLLDLKPWGDKEEAIAIDACIDALHLAKDAAKSDLVEILLRVCGGGKIEIAGEHGGISIKATLTKDGYRLTLGDATHPLSLEEAQKELRRMYITSKAEQAGPANGSQPIRSETNRTSSAAGRR